MKTIAKLLVILMMVLTTSVLFAQGPPDPNGDGNTPGPGNTPVGGGAAVSGGLIVLLALGAGYGAKKVYDLKTKTSE